MNKLHFTLFLALIGWMACSCGSREGTVSLRDLQENFADPPQESRPMVWWHWMNGNITKDGIRKDLEWMDRAGIRGFHHFDAALSTPQVVDERLVYMTPGWKDAFKYAIHVADSLGMEVGIASSPGWSCTGGPWVEPKDAMKKLVWTETAVAGGKQLSLALAEPIKTSGPFFNAASQMIGVEQGGTEIPEYYEDIVVLAVRVPDDECEPDGGIPVLADGDLQTGVQVPSKGGVAMLSYTFPEPVTVCSVTVGDRGGRGRTVLLADGVEVAGILSSAVSRQTVSFPAATARDFTLRVEDAPVNPILAMLGMGDSSGGAFITEFRLSSTPRIQLAEAKAGFATFDGLGKYPTPEIAADFASEAIDLTASFKDGVLEWEAPEGKWKIYRFGWALTGKMNHPAPPEATGLEVDKLDPVAWKAYFDKYLDMYADALGGSLEGIDYILTDSYEAGCETWTPAMFSEFKARRSYDLLPWMPVLTGEVIGSVSKSEQFLRDWRQTLEELVAENYTALSDIARAHGLKGRYSESHENNHALVADGMDMKRTAEVPMAAIWMPGAFAGSSIPTAIADMRESASVSHIFGQKYVAAESMTSVGMFGQAYSYWPGNLKPVTDIEFASGVNRIIVHESAHQPLDDSFPGQSLSMTGQWFNRHETWAEQARAWTDYLARTSYMMQNGSNVADILVYYGDDSCVCVRYGNGEIALPEGYNYDFVSSRILLDDISFKDGSFHAPSGNSWKVLVLDADQLSAEVSARLDAWRSEGARICPLSEVSMDGIPQDLKASAPVRFVHKTVKGGEYYWVSNPSGDFADIKLSLRSTAKALQVWDPETGAIRSADFNEQDGRIVLIWHAEPNDAKFFVLTDKIAGQVGNDVSRQVGNDVSGRAGNDVSGHTRLDRVSQSFPGPWTVSFQSGRGAPASATFETLHSFTDDPDPGIKFFSGTATYTTSFTAPEGRVVLDLGDVQNVVTVIVNGREVRTLWKVPYRVDITDFVKTGYNTLELKVTNLWPNRLIRDAQLPEGERITYTCYSFYGPDDPLRPAGLIGPVTILNDPSVILSEGSI